VREGRDLQRRNDVIAALEDALLLIDRAE